MASTLLTLLRCHWRARYEVLLNWTHLQDSYQAEAGSHIDGFTNSSLEETSFTRIWTVVPVQVPSHQFHNKLYSCEAMIVRGEYTIPQPYIAVRRLSLKVLYIC